MRDFVFIPLRVLSSAPDIRHFRCMDDIRKWLNGSRDYATGVRLYLKHGKDKNLHRLFTAETYSDFKNKKLLEALQAVLANGTAPRITTPVLVTNTAESVQKVTADVKKIAPGANKLADNATKSAKNASAPVKSPNGWSHNMDEVEASLWKQWKPLFAELMDLTNRMPGVSLAAEKDPALEPEATRMALRILELDKLCDQLYHDRDYYLQHKVLPETEDDLGISSSPVDWPRQLESSKRSLRDNKLKAENATDEKKKRKALSNVQFYQKKVDKLKKLLGIEE